MKYFLLRSQFTGLFFAGHDDADGRWERDPVRALKFETADNAMTWAEANGLHCVEAVEVEIKEPWMPTKD